MTADELRARFSRKVNLSDDHHDALTKLSETDGRPVVLWEMGTDAK